ncbi:hypothetical protein CK203_067716 [Vitis vinifera]|uniref:Uncharacterized protein n=1 Tax=Vitis vinifera TaxID=29760 RepID=A0A438BZC9_VITVI|nr:hypothetical protein CK203_067716 [Vitis vinifera]
MVDSIAATSLLGHRPLCGGLGLSCKDISYKRKLSDVCRFPLMEFLGRRISASPYLPRRRGGDRLGALSIKALAMELTKEAHSYKEERIPGI